MSTPYGTCHCGQRTPGWVGDNSICPMPCTLGGQHSDLFFTGWPLSTHTGRMWGVGKKSGRYTITQGYTKCLEFPHVPPNPAPWVGIWNFPSIPKIDHFCWILCHQKILTNDRLQKIGFNQPSICILCKANSETNLHLMIECNFTICIW